MAAIAAILPAAGAAPRLVEEPRARPAAGQVLVRMLRAPVNPADLLTLAGRYALSGAYPLPLGAEGVGEVVETGEGVSALSVGDRVLPLERGNWATHRRLAATSVVRVPAGLPRDDAATLRINPATAWRMLARAERGGLLRPGDWIVQNGGRSHVAGWVRRIARELGYRVISVVRPGGPPCEAMIEDDADLAGRIADRAGPGRIALALDCVAGEATGRLAAALSAGGEVTVFGHLSGEPCRIDSELLTSRGLAVRGFSLRPDEAGDTPDTMAALYASLADLAAAGPPVQVAATYPLGELDRAIAHARGNPHGRILLALDR